MFNRMPQNKPARFFRILCLMVFSLLVLVPNYSDLHAFETGDQFVPDNFASRLMRRYEQMGNNENITYPARVFNMEVSDAKAEEILEHLSVTMSYMTESMYNHYGFKVKSVRFTLEANGEGLRETGDPIPLNIKLGVWWSMGYANNFLGITESWVNNPDYTNSGIFHEFAHHFLLRHLDLNDGYFPRSTMDSPGGDVPTLYNRWGGDDLVGSLHMWRYTDDPDAPLCPEFYTLSTVGVTGASFPDAEPYPDGTWRCDPDRIDRYGMQFRNKADGRCIEGSGSSDGTTVTLSACNDDDISQQWDLLADDDGAFRIVNAGNERCLQIRDDSMSSGSLIELQQCNTADSEDAAQKFYMIADGNGYYSIRSELSGQVVEVSGNNVIQKKPNGTGTQRWSTSPGSGNLAIGKPTSQSSTGWGGVSSRAVDGNTSGNWGDGSVTHTNPQPGAWWRVELGSAHQINSVTLWNRTDCCSTRLSDFHVDLLDANDNVIVTRYHSGTAGVQTDISISADGVYAVRVQLSGNNILSLAEVQVFGGSASSPTGTVTRQVWTGVDGTQINKLTSHPDYPHNPHITDELESFEAPVNWADNYGTRIVGYLHPQVTGMYTFWIASDDNGELWLSTDDSAVNKQRIAYVPGWSSSRQWNKFSQQRSVGIQLSAGQRYYIEALQKEHGGGDNLEVAWQQPGGSQEVIPGSYLSPYVLLDTQPDTYALTVNYGSGSGNYEASTEVAITADTPMASAGLVFDQWIVENGGGVVGDVHSSSTVVTMPTNAVTVTATFRSIADDFRDPENPPNTVNGLSYKYFHGSWNLLPDFDTLIPEKTGTVSNYTINEQLQSDNFGFAFTGYIDVPTDGIYTFYTSSDDGSKLYIGSSLVVSNDGLHGMQERSGQIGLKRGKHAVRVDFFEKTGGAGLEVRYEGPGISKRLVPDSSLYHIPQITTYPLTVTSGQGSDSYAAGANVIIRANNAPPGKVFEKWVKTLGNPQISDITAATTTLTMPANAATVTATYKDDLVLRNPENPSNTVGGLDYSYYHGDWNVLPNFNALTPVKNGTIPTFTISGQTQDDYFGFSYSGFIDVPTDGIYTFYTRSDDGSKLYIGSTLVVSNDGLHPMQERSGQIGLKRGKHAIQVDFFEKTGGAGLEVRYEGPGISKRLTPGSSLYRVPQISTSASLTITSDNAYQVYFNGQHIGSGTNWVQAQTYSNLNVQAGNNVIAVKATDAGGIAGLLAELSLNGNRIGTSSAWKTSLTAPVNWTSPSLDDSSWNSATEHGGYGVSPWGTNVANIPNDTPGKWIWSSDNQNHNTVYLRYSFNNGSTTPTNKLKIFVLAGQSNMEGHGHMYQTQALLDRNGGKGTLEYLTRNPATADTYKHVIDTNGDWVRRNDVWIANLGNNGPLTAGYGAADYFIGPEFQFGHVVGDYFDAPVLIIKTAWGGKSLYVDFRPPGSGGTLGPYYTQMVNEVRAVLNNIRQVMPHYDGQGYEIAGFGWHQGWNDRINEAAVDEYQINCVNLINDVRAEFNVPDMPFVIATTGMSGFNETHPRALKLMEAQLAVANDSRVINGRVFTVETRPFWREGAVSPSDASYHWNHSAEIQFLIGNGIGEAMIQFF